MRRTGHSLQQRFSRVLLLPGEKLSGIRSATAHRHGSFPHSSGTIPPSGWLGRILAAWRVLAVTVAVPFATALYGAALPTDPMCGPEIITVADAWSKLDGELRLIESLPEQSVTDGPSHLPAAKAHLRFVRDRSMLLSSEARSNLVASVGAWIEEIDRIEAAAPEKRPDLLRVALPQFRLLQQKIAKLYPPAALNPAAPEALTMTGLPAPTLRIRMGELELKPGVETQVRFQLLRPNGRPVQKEELSIHQERLLHAFLLDRTFTDFHHAHPTPTATPGEYELVFTPAKSGNYRLWLNVISQPFQLEEFLQADLLKQSATPELNRTTSTEFTNAEGSVRMEWLSGPPLAGRKANLRMTFSSADGTPVNRLEPYLGSFAHLIGFSEDYRTVVHIHPASVPSATARGGPVLEFPFIVPKSGFIRLFVQTQVGGKLHLATFGFQAVAPSP